MKLTKIATLFASAMLVTSSLAWTNLLQAGEANVVKHVIKIEAESDNEVTILVDQDGQARDYSFNFDQLSDLDAISDQLDDLDSESKDAVLHALEQLTLSGGKFISINAGEGEEIEKKIIMVNAHDSEDNVHVEMEVEGEGFSNQFHVVKVLGEGGGSDKAVHKHMKFFSSDGGDLTSVIKGLIKKAELTPEQIDELRQALNEK
jgi:hypothetical protein